MRALLSSQLHNLNPDILRRLVAFVSDEDMICVLHTCKALHAAAILRCKTDQYSPILEFTAAAVLSSIERFTWVQRHWGNSGPQWMTGRTGCSCAALCNPGYRCNCGTSDGSRRRCRCDKCFIAQTARGDRIRRRERIKWMYKIARGEQQGLHFLPGKEDEDEMSEPTTRVCEKAAAAGHLELLKYARQEGHQWNDAATREAGKNGHLETLKWLRSQGCPWCLCLCSLAAKEGHFNILKWARANGCPWCYATCVDNAEKAGHVKIKQWLLVNDEKRLGDICLNPFLSLGRGVSEPGHQSEA